MRMRQWLLRWPTLAVLVGLMVASPAGAATAAARNRSAEARLERDITFLASDECEGRGPATLGLDLAALYVAAQFKKAGLQPTGPDGSYFQPFSINGAILDEPARLVLKGPRGQEITLKQGVDFQPMGLGHAGKLSAPAAFAGYGVTAGKPKYDDYDGLDVEDKVVVLLRGAPRAGGAGGEALWQSAPFVRKVANAQKHHAAAVLIVNDEATARDGDALLDFNFTALDGGGAGLPAFHVRRSVLEKMLEESAAADLKDLQHDIDRDLKPHSLDLKGWTVSLEVKMHRGKVGLKNVVGVLEGAGPLANETVVIGAHYDHLGHGGSGSRSGGKKPAIHHGADDNGSGTTVLMELARRFGAVPDRQGRRLVFIAFSGEERGLLGSAHYAKNPLFPLADTVAMFNLDMVGRLRVDNVSGKDKLLVEGNATSKAFDRLVDRLNRTSDFDLKKSKGLVPNSDHYSFYQKKIPVLFFWTGYHADYHMPTDTADKINVAGMRKIADLSAEVIEELATRPARPDFQKVKIAGGGGSPSNGPRLGIMPGYGGNEDGLEVDAVSDGGPAARAGLKEGDRIVAINGQVVKNIGTYMQAMSRQKKGSTIEVEVVRAGKKQAIKVKLD